MAKRDPGKRAARASSSSRAAYQLKVTLRGSEPEVWRRFRIARDATLADLHDVLQVVMGWEDCHLHAFTISGKRYGQPQPDEWAPVEDEATATLTKVLPRAGGAFEYEYDFGDSWVHTIGVEKVVSEVDRAGLPVCSEGMWACPPEDSGGVWGYHEKLRIRADRDDPEHDEVNEWLGDFDPEAFDLDAVNRALARLRSGNG